MALILVPVVGCTNDAGLPHMPSDEYDQTVSLFNSAVARMRVGDDRGAEYRLMQATAMAPGEPAIWYNLGLLSMRNGRLDSATDYMGQARLLAEGNLPVLFLSGFVASAQNATEEAEVFFRSAVDAGPDDLRALFALEQFMVSRGEAQANREAADLVDRILRLDAGNLHALLERLRSGIRMDAPEVIRESLDAIGTTIPDGSDAAQAALSRVRAAAEAPDGTALEETIERLENTLMRYRSYRSARERLLLPPGRIATEMADFILLSNPPSGPYPADLSLDYRRQSAEFPMEKVAWISVPVLKDDGIPNQVAASEESVQLDSTVSVSFPPGLIGSGVSRFRIVPIDYDYDYRIDLAVAGDGGFRLLRHDAEGQLEDVTAATGLPETILERSYIGGWAIDLDSEGDMDLVLGTSDEPVVLRNNGDGTFQEINRFDEAKRLREAIWFDADEDGDLDAFFLRSDGSIVGYTSVGAGQYDVTGIPVTIPTALAIAAADQNNDTYTDLLVLTADGRIVRITPALMDSDWVVAELLANTSLTAPSSDTVFAGLYTADLDNNATLDLVASVDGATRVWLTEASGDLVDLVRFDDLNVIQVMDLVGVGREDLVGVERSGRPVQMMNTLDNTYKSRTLEPQTITALGDRRINSYGIGGTIEITSGRRIQHRLITGPIVHFGLGDQTTVEAARIHWPNGVAQSLFDLETDQAILAREGLNSSCPWLYAVTDDGVVFLEDFLMRSPLGFRLSETEFMPLGDGEDRIKVDGRILSEVDGAIELRLTAELWETIYVDRMSLVAVDHPEGTEVYINETFASPQPPLDPILMEAPVSIVGAWDGEGRSVLEALREIDSDVVHGFELASNLGMAEEHYLEIDLGPEFIPAKSSWLVAEGWLRAGTSSINLAISQSRALKPPFVLMEYLDEEGEWRRSEAVVGIPYGSRKSLVVDMNGAIPAGASSRIRLRTNLEIYWDRIFWAPDREDGDLRRQTLEPASTALRYRGFSATETPDRWHPDVPQYDQIAFSTPVWLDPSGYYTRYGEVDELVERADDRYAIMSPGDELALRFLVPDPPPRGWVRDYILIGSGWTKDGGHATLHSKTVLPLPSLGKPYPTVVLPLEEDPVYKRFASDWDTYHTRYVAGGFAHQKGN